MLKILQEKNVRMIWTADGKDIWFNLSDVGEELGVINIRQLLPNIDREYKKKFKELDVYKVYNRNFKEPINNRGELYITEEAVYNLSFRSNKPEAKLFTKWVTKVLKEIRINGYYIATDKDDKWLGVRNDSKVTRREFTDEIQEFVYYATTQGSKKPEMYYIHFTKLVNEKLGIPKGINRDELSQGTLMDISALERVMSMKLPKLVNKEMPYKEVYKEIKGLIQSI